jgi:hypothetical protein
MMDFDPGQSSHIHRWPTAVRPISRSDSFDRKRFGIGMLERFLERWVMEALLEEQFGSAKRDRSRVGSSTSHHVQYPSIVL